MKVHDIMQQLPPPPYRQVYFFCSNVTVLNVIRTCTHFTLDGDHIYFWRLDVFPFIGCSDGVISTSDIAICVMAMILGQNSPTWHKGHRGGWLRKVSQIRKRTHSGCSMV